MHFAPTETHSRLAEPDSCLSEVKQLPASTAHGIESGSSREVRSSKSSTRSIWAISSRGRELELDKQEFGARPVAGARNRWFVFIALIAKMVNSRFYSPANVWPELEFLPNRGALQPLGLKRAGVGGRGPDTTRRERITEVQPAWIFVASSDHNANRWCGAYFGELRSP